MLLRSLFLLLPTTLLAQAPDWQWAHGAGGSNSDQGSAICTDAAGNIYLTGSFQSNGMSFGSISLSNTLSNNTSDAFLVKLDPAGNVLWAEQIGSTGYEQGSALALAPDGGVILGMTFQNSVTIGTETHTANGGNALLVVKYDSDGTPLWSYQAGSESSLDVNDVATATDGKVAICGAYSGNDMQTGVGTYANAGNDDMYVIVLDANGQPIWSDNAGSNLEETARSVAFTSNGDLVIGGYYTSAQIELAGSTLVNADDNDNDLFIARYDGTGNGIWALGAGTNHTENLIALEVDAQDAIVICGSFDGAEFNLLGTTLTNTTSDNSWYDHYVAKLDGSGTLLWAVSGGGERDDFMRALALDEAGNIVIAGDFDSQTAVYGNTTLTSIDAYDPYVVEYSPSGDLMWATSASGQQSDYSNGLAVDGSGGIIITGRFNEDLGLGSLAIESEGDNDVWVAKLGGTTGLGEWSAQIRSNVLFDPATGSCIIRSDLRMDEVIAMDAAGRTMGTWIPRSDQLRIILKSAGVHLLRIRSGTLWETHRLVVPANR